MKTAAALILALFLAACGGGGDDAETPETVLLDETRTLTGGTAAVLQTNITAQVTDVRFTTTKPGAVTVCLDVTWTQTLKKPATVSLSYAGQTVSSAGVAGSGNVLTISACRTTSPSPGTHALNTVVEATTDCRCADALGAYTATARWRVTQQ